MKKRLPPLNWLRAFEVSARHLNFTHAAQELNLSQAAISQQLKALESQLGAVLFKRLPRGLELTELGMAYFPVVRKSVEWLAATDEIFGQGHRSVLIVRSSLVFFTQWLVIRLPRFKALHPTIQLRVDSSIWVEDADSDADLEIRYGQGRWSGRKSERLATPEEHAHVGTIDVMCSFAAALGVATALYRKHRHGEAHRARTSLAALGNLVQIPFCYDYPGRGPFDEPSGRQVAGYSELSRIYRTADGWIYPDAQARDLERLCALPGFADLAAAADRQTYLQQVIGEMSSAALQASLQAANIAAAVPDNIDSLRQGYSRQADGLPGTANSSYSFSVYEDHPNGHRITQLDPYAIRPRSARIRALPPAETFGASTRKVLQRLGYSAEQIGRLLEKGAISESWSAEYLPS